MPTLEGENRRGQLIETDPREASGSATRTGLAYRFRFVLHAAPWLQSAGSFVIHDSLPGS